MTDKRPRLRTVNKSKALYPLNKFPSDFPYILGKEIVYHLVSTGKARLSGQEWEEIFATCIGAKWKPSNVGLDDIVSGNTAWGAKSIKHKRPYKQSKVRLISGRNSIVYSFGEKIDIAVDPNLPGEQVLKIWNERVSAVRTLYKNLRTVVLIKSYDLKEVVVFEFDTIRYDPELFYWKWNKNNNLEGYCKSSKAKKFTWQPHGSQFTIHEEVPKDKLTIRINNPSDLNLDKDMILKTIGFNKSWIEILK